MGSNLLSFGAALIIFVAIILTGCAGGDLDAAKKKNTKAAPDQLLDDNGNNQHASQAKKLREELTFEKARKRNTIKGYDEYLEKYPNGSFVAEVNQLKETAWFEKTKKQDTMKGYDEYLEKYPNGSFVAEANKFRDLKANEDHIKEKVMKSMKSPQMASADVDSENWGMVPPLGCYWDCIQPEGCSFASNPISSEPDDSWEWKKQPGMDPPLVQPYFSKDGNLILSKIIAVDGFATRITEKGAEIKGKLVITSDPYGWHLNPGWVAKCINK